MTSRRLLGVAIGAVAAVSVISMGASAMAAPEAVHSSHPTNFRESAKSAKVVARPAAGTVTHHYSLAASAFAPDGLHTTTEDYFNSWGAVALSNTDSGRCFDVGLALPPNVTLKSAKFYYTAGSAAMFVEVFRSDLVHQQFLDLASTDTTIESTPIYTNTTLNFAKATSVVNMTNYAYSVGVCPSGTTTFSGVTITYTQPAS